MAIEQYVKLPHYSKKNMREENVKWKEAEILPSGKWNKNSSHVKGFREQRKRIWGG